MRKIINIALLSTVFFVNINLSADNSKSIDKVDEDTKARMVIMRHIGADRKTDYIVKGDQLIMKERKMTDKELIEVIQRNK